jgi:hypothetical protein
LEHGFGIWRKTRIARIKTNYADLKLEFGIWNLDFGFGFGFGIWNLEFGI